MMRSKIEWTDRSDWNPIRGCTRVSPGCGGPGPHGGCYAEAIAARFSDPGQAFHGFAERTKSGPRWTGKVELQEERLTLPLRWKKPARIFASSTSDIFHESLPDEVIDRVFAIMAIARQHTFQVLTKRAERMRDYAGHPERGAKVWWQAHKIGGICEPWPLPNVWLGVSVEDQQRADERVPLLLDTPASKRFISAEPLLGPIDLARIRIKLGEESWMERSALYAKDSLNLGREEHRLDWVIVGGESGPGSRPMEMRWVHDIVSQCQAAGTAIFVKQLGSKPVVGGQTYTHPYARTPAVDQKPKGKGGDMGEWPTAIRVREFPA